MIVNVNGADLHVEVLGDEAAPVLIAHHGGGGIGSSEEPRATFGPLADLFRVIVFDARGCGRSEGVPPYSHEQWAADLERDGFGPESIQRRLRRGDVDGWSCGLPCVNLSSEARVDAFRGCGARRRTRPAAPSTPRPAPRRGPPDDG